MDELLKTRLIEKALEREERLKQIAPWASGDRDDTAADLALRENTRLLEELKGEE
jgi:hypothetical protein